MQKNLGEFNALLLTQLKMKVSPVPQTTTSKHAKYSISVGQITPEVVLSSIELLEGNQLRAMDAIHIACAKTLGVDLFVSADHRQLRAADHCGLKTADVS